jgi:hypothetical protein
VPRSKLGYITYTSAALWLTDMPLCVELLAKIGYAYIERFGTEGGGPPSPVGYGGMVGPSGTTVAATPKQLKQVLDANGMWCSGGHDAGVWPYDENAFKQTVEAVLILEQPYIGSNPTFPTTVASCKQFAETMYKEVAVAKSMGFLGSIYSHFDLNGSLHPLTDDPSQTALDVIVQNTTGDVWNPEVDTEHALQMLGSIPAVLALVRRYPGRFHCLHMKDGTTPVELPGVPLQQTESTGASTEFGYGDWAKADPSDPKGRPHAGFQDLLTALADSGDWTDSRPLLIAEMDGSPTGLDYAELYYPGMNGLQFKYNARSGSGCSTSGATTTPAKHGTSSARHKKRKKAHHKKSTKSRRPRRDAGQSGFTG